VTRTDTKVVTFRRTFRLKGFDGDMPPGAYAVVTDEERLDLSFEAYRRVATWIRVPVRSSAGSSQVVQIDPVELEAALAHDATDEPC
jgi:hypothetical protein